LFLNLRNYELMHRWTIMRYKNSLKLAENCAPLGYYTACSGNFLPTFRDNLTVPSSGVKTTRRVTAQKSAVLIYLVADAWDLASLELFRIEYFHLWKENILIYQYQCSETNVMHFSFNLLRIKGLYMFRALLAHPQEVLHKRHLVYCVCVMSVGCTRVKV
jgi:hypothetical protein